MSGKRKQYTRRIKELRTYIMALLMAVSIWFLFQFILFRVFHWKIQLIVIGIVIILNAVSYDMMFVKKRRRRRLYRRAGKVLGVFWTVVLAVLAFSMNRIDAVLGSMSFDNEETETVSLIVLEDSPLKEPEDFTSSDVIGIQNLVFAEATETMLDNLESRLGEMPGTKDCERLGELINALYDGEVQAIVLDEDYRAAAYDEKQDFGSLTRVISSVNYKKMKKNISRKVAVAARPYLTLVSGIGSYGTLDTISKPDEFVLVAINPRKAQVLFVYIPADSYMLLKTNNNAMEQIEGHGDLLAHSGLFGTECTLRTLEKEWGISINYYVTCEFSALDDLENALGVAKSGGKEGFEQFRDVALDFARPAVLWNYSKIARILRSSVELDFSVLELKDMLKQRMTEEINWKVEEIHLDGTYEQKTSWFYGDEVEALCLDKDSVEEAVEKIEIVMGKRPQVDEVEELLEESQETEKESSEEAQEAEEGLW